MLTRLAQTSPAAITPTSDSKIAVKAKFFLLFMFTAFLTRQTARASLYRIAQTMC